MLTQQLTTYLLPSKTQNIPCSSAKAAYVLFIAGSLIAPLAGGIDDGLNAQIDVDCCLPERRHNSSFFEWMSNLEV